MKPLNSGRIRVKRLAGKFQTTRLGLEDAFGDWSQNSHVLCALLVLYHFTSSRQQPSKNRILKPFYTQREKRERKKKRERIVERIPMKVWHLGYRSSNSSWATSKTWKKKINIPPSFEARNGQHLRDLPSSYAMEILVFLTSRTRRGGREFEHGHQHQMFRPAQYFVDSFFPFVRSFVRFLIFFLCFSKWRIHVNTHTEFRKLRGEEGGPEGSNASRSVVSIDPNQKYPPVSTGHQKKKSFPAITSAQMSMSSNCAGTHRQTHTPDKSISSTETKSTTNSHPISILFCCCCCFV